MGGSGKRYRSAAAASTRCQQHGSGSGQRPGRPPAPMHDVKGIGAAIHVCLHFCLGDDLPSLLQLS